MIAPSWIRTGLLSAVLLLGLGCGRRLQWNEKRIEEVAIGDFVIAVPSCWRDVSELRDQSFVRGLPPGARAITPEAAGAVGFQPNIIFAWAERKAGTAPECSAYAASIAAQQNGTASAVTVTQIDGDTVCRWQWASDNGKGVTLSGMAAARYHGDHELAVSCLHAAGEDLEVETVCEQLLTDMKATE